MQEFCDICGKKLEYFNDPNIVSGMECPDGCTWNRERPRGLASVACASVLAMGFHLMWLKWLDKKHLKEQARQWERDARPGPVLDLDKLDPSK